MGYVSKVPYPSPLQLLAIMSAHGNGMNSHAVHRHTGHSNSTITRWSAQWGHDAAVFDDWVRRYRIDITGHRFSDYWPHERELRPDGYRCAPVEEPRKFIADLKVRR